MQSQIDSKRLHTERNKLGQFATPTRLATDILEYAKSLWPHNQKVRFLDPAIGTGSFYSALLRVFPATHIEEATGYEIDADYARTALKLPEGAPLTIKTVDFTSAMPPRSDKDKFNLIICNPPYIRHHHLPHEEKERLQRLTEKTTGIRFSGLTGVYCHFLCLSHEWMAPEALAGWLIPSEFMSVNYGRELKKYLLDRVRLLRIHRFDPNNVQFEDALVSSAVVWFRNVKPPAEYSVEFTFGGTLSNPKVSGLLDTKVLRCIAKWTKFPFVNESTARRQVGLRLGDLFDIKRGIATGANNFFILSMGEAVSRKLPERFLKPVLPGPRDLDTDEIRSDPRGNPLVNRKLVLLACSLPAEAVAPEYPSLWEYLQEGVRKDVNNRYLCRHRSPWYSQENRPPAPFLCTYMGRHNTRRGKPFRFILNRSSATALNVYLMLYPKPWLADQLDASPKLLERVWEALNGIPTPTLVAEGRVYGGGLHKLEPKELAEVPADAVLAALPKPIDMWT